MALAPRAERPPHHRHHGRAIAVARPMVMLRAAIRDLSPSSFAMVMATGIVALALDRLGMPAAAIGFFIVGVVMYGVLTLMSLVRATLFWTQFSHDLLDHRRAPGFFTLVASSCILGAQSIVQFHSLPAAEAFWGLGVILWISLTYTIFTGLTVKRHKPNLASGITGAWLLAIVATQSVAVLSTHLAAAWPPPYRLELNFFAMALWLWGGMFYIWTISLIFYRYTFFVLSPRDLSPPYWINMGAMAISVLAGTRLVDNSVSAPFLLELLPFVKGFTIFYWITGTWWIPVLVVLGLWRYVFRHSPLHYAPANWGAVFPLGMYTVCTLDMARALGLPFLYPVPRFFLIIALAAWALTFGGLVHHLVSWTIRLLRAAGPRRLMRT